MINVSKIKERLQSDFPDKSFSFENDILTIDEKYKLKLDISNGMEDLNKFHGVDPLDEVYKIVKNEILSVT